MFWRKILFLAAWYVAGNIVGWMYGKHRKKTKKSSTSPSWDIKNTAHEFIQTQKAFLKDIENKYIPEDKREMFEQKKAAFLNQAEKYMKKWETLFWEIKENKTVQQSSKKAKNVFHDVSEKWRVAVAKARDKMKKEEENKF